MRPEGRAPPFRTELVDSMNDLEIQAIVDEVIRRIRANNRGRYLAILRSGKEEAAARQYFSNKSDGFMADKLLMSQMIAESQKNAFAPQEKAEQYDGFVFAGLSLKQLIGITRFEPDCPIVETIIEALRAGKPCVVISKWFDITGGTKAFTNRVKQIKDQLKTFGVTVVSEDELTGSPFFDTENGNNAAQDRSHTTRIDQRVIAKQNLKNVQGGLLEIPADAVLTTTAKELIQKRNIVIKRYSI